VNWDTLSFAWSRHLHTAEAEKFRLLEWRTKMMKQLVVATCMSAGAMVAGLFVTLPLATEVHAQSNCVSLVNNQFYNGCGRAVMVRWTDQGGCNNGNCAWDIGPNRFANVGGFNGSVCWSVAWYPQNPSYPSC
jgi:hypothetical protein